MPTSTYDLIASNVLGSSAASVTFSSISGSFRDLVLVINATGTSGAPNTYIRVNSDTSNSYSYVLALGNGSTTTSTSGASVDYFLLDWNGMSTTSSSISLVQFLDYSATDKHKTILARHSLAAKEALMGAGRWASTSAITSITTLPASGSFAAGSSFYLYGIVS